jgi:hypothetical protein
MRRWRCLRLTSKTLPSRHNTLSPCLWIPKRKKQFSM